MSYVINCILSFSTIENEELIMIKINEYFIKERPNEEIFVSCDDTKLPLHWYGGSKMLETPLYIGAFNFLDINELCNHIRKIKFIDSDAVQLIIKCHEENRFSIINVFEEK